MYKKKQIHGSSTDFKESFKFFETIKLWIINWYQLSIYMIPKAYT